MSETVSDRARVLRGAKRAVYDKRSIYQSLDATFLCHVGYVFRGEARIIPTAFVRVGDAIYIHGNRKNGAMNSILDGQVVCTEVTIVDGLVLSRSAFSHSVNYRSVICYGIAEEVEGKDKVSVLDALIEHYVPGRMTDLRPHYDEELAATLVIKLPITEAAAKVRAGPPMDRPEDYDGTTWAGVIPTETAYGKPIPCEKLRNDQVVPTYLANFYE
ncbi:pyridoxamine 5'-phosphate oxidase family protein [Aurantivibrio plasticivorans]